ncbi:MAG: STT3 domain-containing protein [Candidatus Aenigmatarchaeota archaeon]|nr:hypothetical protein [Candidatus Aenigmarchaeota archaeon]
MDIKKILIFFTVFCAFIFTVYLSIYVRLGTINSPTVLDFDPWYFYRYAQDIIKNNYKLPEWDILTYYPPGRPVQLNQGWPYTIALLYKGIQNFSPSITLTDVAKISPLIMIGLTAFVTFLFGILIFRNYIAGIALALFSTLTPTLIGVSMAGYNDTDVVVVFYTFLSLLSYFLLIENWNKKWKAIPFYLLAIVTNLIFVFNWGAGWLPSILLLVTLPSFFVYKIFEDILHQKRLKFNWKYAFNETKPIALPLLIVFLVINIVGYFLGFLTMFHSLLGGLGFTGIAGEPLIVNISVAELQKINIFTKEGFLSVANRVGLLPTMLTFFGTPLWFLYKFYKKQKITLLEIFIIVWTLISFYLISKGVRFSLLFSIAASTSAAYFLAKLFEFLKNKNQMLIASISGVLFVFIIIFITDAIKIGLASTGTLISQNWYNALDWLKENADKDSLIATWWDPGHIITGYTGLKVHADGAHCGPGLCIPYNHNIRIRDMGRIFSTNNESESIQILKKYTHLTNEQCNEVKRTFGNIVPEDACKDVTEVYVLATSDLIGKYFWMSCFGNFNMERWKAGNRNPSQLCEGRNFIQIPFSNFDRSGLPVYSNEFMTVTLVQNDTKILAVINVPSQGIRNALISDVVYYLNGVEQRSHVNTTNLIDGMIWIDPSFRLILFMDQKVRDSLFTKMFFFDGRDLNNFELVYSNPEVKIYKAKIE